MCSDTLSEFHGFIVALTDAFNVWYSPSTPSSLILSFSPLHCFGVWLWFFGVWFFSVSEVMKYHNLEEKGNIKKKQCIISNLLLLSYGKLHTFFFLTVYCLILTFLSEIMCGLLSLLFFLEYKVLSPLLIPAGWEIKYKCADMLIFFWEVSVHGVLAPLGSAHL